VTSAAAAAALHAGHNNAHALAHAAAAERDTPTPSVHLGRRVRSGRQLVGARARAKVDE
jgi:hypothetical protein